MAANTENRKERQSRVCVPVKSRKWIEAANVFNKANGKRLYSIQRVMQVIVDRASENMDLFFEGVDESELTDTRHNSGRKPKQKD